MKMNLSLMKLIIRLLILMIFFVIIFLITALLYSSRYWPDVYNYINANITIKRIPTLSELNLTVLEVDWTTEFYTTVEDDESATVEGFDFDIDEFTNIQGELVDAKRPKRNANGDENDGVDTKMDFEPKSFKTNAKIEKFENDYSELPTRSVVVDYFFLQDTTIDDGVVWKKIVKDLIDESKLVPKNLGEIEMVNRNNGRRLQKLTNICHGNTSDVSNIYPWIASIFIKNDTANNQFQYTCDGALLSDKLLITAARCVTFLNSTVELDDVLVFLGKRSLQVMGEGEKNVRISQVIIHANFSTGDGKVMNDLALLVLEEPVAFSGGIRPACLGSGDDFGKSASTAWDLSGALTPVFFENNKDCREMETDGTLCATYGNEVALCPSYGGIFASKHADRWYLHGIRSGDVADRGVCYSKNVAYTPLSDHHNWIMKYIE